MRPAPVLRSSFSRRAYNRRSGLRPQRQSPARRGSCGNGVTRAPLALALVLVLVRNSLDTSGSCRTHWEQGCKNRSFFRPSRSSVHNGFRFLNWIEEENRERERESTSKRGNLYPPLHPHVPCPQSPPGASARSR